MQKDARIYSDSVRENHSVVVEAMRPTLEKCTSVLEIASGSGEHAIHFTAALPDVHWQPSDRDPAAIASIQSWVNHCDAKLLRQPIRLDVMNSDWNLDQKFDAIVNINMIHISPWEATLNLFAHASHCINPNGFVLFYGPFNFKNQEPAASNIQFNTWLKNKDPRFGVRFLEDVKAVARKNHFKFKELVSMPRDNSVVIFQRD